MISGGFLTRMAKRSPAAPVSEDTGNPLPPELEARIEAFEVAAPAADFGVAGWCWMILLGIAIPVVLLAVGWWA
jgi:hypothetical protein